MVDQMTLQTIGILLTAVTVSIAAVYYTLTLRYTRRNQELQLESRQAQLFSSIMDRMDNVEWWTHYMTIRDAQNRTYEEWDEILRDPVLYAGTASIMAFFNHVGWLVKKGLIDMETVEENLATEIVRVYEHMTPYVDEYERRTGRSQRFEHLEYLYEHVKDAYYRIAQEDKA